MLKRPFRQRINPEKAAKIIPSLMILKLRLLFREEIKPSKRKTMPIARIMVKQKETIIKIMPFLTWPL
jgi:hypothetical protein